MFTLLLVVLLANASRRANETSQEQLDVVAEALAALMDSAGASDPELRDAATRLRDAVGLEARHRATGHAGSAPPDRHCGTLVGCASQSSPDLIPVMPFPPSLCV